MSHPTNPIAFAYQGVTVYHVRKNDNDPTSRLAVYSFSLTPGGINAFDVRTLPGFAEPSTYAPGLTVAECTAQRDAAILACLAAAIEASTLPGLPITNPAPTFLARQMFGPDKNRLLPVAGKLVALASAPDFTFFAYRGEKSRWYVVEHSTGCPVNACGATSRKQAITEAEAKILGNGGQQGVTHMVTKVLAELKEIDALLAERCDADAPATTTPASPEPAPADLVTVCERADEYTPGALLHGPAGFYVAHEGQPLQGPYTAEEMAGGRFGRWAERWQARREAVAKVRAARKLIPAGIDPLPVARRIRQLFCGAIVLGFGDVDWCADLALGKSGMKGSISPTYATTTFRLPAA